MTTDQRKEYYRMWYEKNRRRTKARMKKYYRAHRNEVLAAQKATYGLKKVFAVLYSRAVEPVERELQLKINQLHREYTVKKERVRRKLAKSLTRAIV